MHAGFERRQAGFGGEFERPLAFEFLGLDRTVSRAGLS
jgi:hypothetical protein